ncbi:aspartic peptidase domain-containing protein [Dichotomocladium elegans]|nr:aspartic peptidase domain-containing protein [Dichotomocladium elegans]
MSLVPISDAQVITVPLIRNPRNQLTRIHQGLQVVAKRSESDEQRPSGPGDSLISTINREFFVEVYVGMPPQAFNLTVDTASSSLWLLSVDNSETDCLNGCYNPSKSMTIQNSNVPFSFDYNVGTVNGTFCTESVSLAGFTIPNQTVALANAMNGRVFSKDEIGNGVIGFAYPGRKTARGILNDVPFIFNLFEQGLISKPVFSVYLNDYDNHNGNQLTLGGIDNSKYKGTLQYAPVLLYSDLSDLASTTHATHAYWAVGGTAVQTSMGYKSTSNDLEEFVLDTASTLTYSPHAEDIIKSLNITHTIDDGTGAYLVDCASQKDIQNITITFQVARTLLGSRTHRFSNPINVTVAVKDLLMPGNSKTFDKATTCLFGIVPTKQSRTIIGISVLRSVYTVYDIHEDRIGFAPAI